MSDNFLIFFKNCQNWQCFLGQNLFLAFIAFIICFIALRFFIKFINNGNFLRQPIRQSGPKSHLLEKKNTPTMGGIAIIFTTIILSLLFFQGLTSHLKVIIFIILSFGLIGFIDDFIKVTGANSKGFRGSVKLVLQFILVGLSILYLQSQDPIYVDNEIAIPFSDNYLDLGIFYILFATIVVVGCANAVNLTDGLDGLVSVPAILVLFLLSLISYVVGSNILSDVIGVKFVSGVSYIAYFCAIMIGAILAFLKYNLKPAKIFMGDVGSLTIGGVVGIIAIILKQELIFFIMALLFVIEALSVILQVASFKLTGKRIFLMAPLHHHFEKMGWHEVKVVRFFWLLSLIFAFIALLGFLFDIF